MRVTICGSVAFYGKLAGLKEELEKLGVDEAVIPFGFGVDEDKKAKLTLEEDAKRKIEYDLINKHYQHILRSDAVLVANYDKNGIKGYIGGNTLLEMAFAFVNNRDIFLLNPAPTLLYTAEIDGMKPIVVNEDVSKTVAHYNTLPLVYVASERASKLDAVAFGLRAAGFRAHVVGEKVKSGVGDQPIGLSDIVKGAENRIKALKKKKRQEGSREFEYLVAIESGVIKAGTRGDYYDVALCAIEDKRGNRETAVAGGFRVPSEWMKKVLKKGGELGNVVPGISDKDTVSYLTGGKVARSEVLGQAVKIAYSNLVNSKK